MHPHPGLGTGSRPPVPQGERRLGRQPGQCEGPGQEDPGRRTGHQRQRICHKRLSGCPRKLSRQAVGLLLYHARLPGHHRGENAPRTGGRPFLRPGPVGGGHQHVPRGGQQFRPRHKPVADLGFFRILRHAGKRDRPPAGGKGTGNGQAKGTGKGEARADRPGQDQPQQLCLPAYPLRKIIPRHEPVPDQSVLL